MTTFWSTLRERILSRYYAALSLLYLLGILSILRANRSYLDDMGRSLYGYADWVAAARPLAELFSWFFYLGPTTADASPLTQILAAAILALVSLMLIEAVRARLNWKTLICTVPVGLSPYGLENLSYKFDSPGMALALLLAVLPCWLLRVGRRGFPLWSALCLFASASLYQPALGAYLAIAVYASLTELASRRSTRCIMRRLFRFLLPFCLGVGLYTVQTDFWISASQYQEYVLQHASVPPLAQLPAELLENIPVYVGLLIRDWGCNGLGALLGLTTLYFLLQLLSRWRHSTSRCNGTARAWGRLCLILLLFPCFLLCPFGVQFLLSNPVWAPRTFFGFGVMAALMLLSLYSFARGRVSSRLIQVVLGLFLIQLLMFANVYGNLLDAQNRWEMSRMSLLSSDLNRYIKETGSSKVAFVGSMGLSPLAMTPARKFPLLQRLVTVPLTRNWRWGYEQLYIFGVRVDRVPVPEGSERLEPFMENPRYRIQRGPDDVGIVTFLPPPEPRPKKTRPPQKKVSPASR